MILQQQGESLHPSAPMLKKEEGAIQWSQPADAIDRQVRAFDPWPGTYTHWNGQLLKILAGVAVDDRHGESQPGLVIHWKESEIAIKTGDGLYFSTKIQVDWK